MGEFTDKAKGMANEAMGATKRAIGKATDNPKLEVKGAAQQLKGKAQQAVGDVKGRL